MVCLDFDQNGKSDVDLEDVHKYDLAAVQNFCRLATFCECKGQALSFHKDCGNVIMGKPKYAANKEFCYLNLEAVR